MKNMMRIFGIGFCILLAACTDIEPVGVEVPAVPRDLSVIKAFKSTEHPFSLAWFGNWKADGNMNTYLNALPDSLDVIVLESGYETISSLQKEDLSVVKAQKGTKILVSVDLDLWVSELRDELETAESDAEADAIEAAKEAGREVTSEEIDEAVKAAQEKVREAMKAKLYALPDRIAKIISDNGYDGMSLRISAIKQNVHLRCGG